MGSKSSLINNAFKKAGQIIYPNVCLHCEGIGEQGLDLCMRCYQNLPWVEYSCQKCALPLASGNANICGACAKREYFFDQAIAPFHFDGFIKDAVYEFKFKQKLNQGKLLAQLLLRHIENSQIEVPDVIIPVPLHKRRIRQRGYNQALELARILAKNLASEISYKSVYRNRDTSVQMELPAKRRYNNVKDAFTLKEEAVHLRNKHICIVDDVMTTGNTVNEVAKCLKKAGARKMDAWCIARVA